MQHPKLEINTMAHEHHTTIPKQPLLTRYSLAKLSTFFDINNKAVLCDDMA